MIKLLFIAAFLASSAVSANNETAYDLVQKRAEDRHGELQKDGLSYMVGGGLGLASSLALGISSTEIFPKLGYSLIQGLSSAAIAYGGILYFTGDEFTREAEKLRDLSTLLAKTPNLTVAQREKILDEATRLAVHRATERKRSVKRIRETLEFTTAASAGATMAFSKNSSMASNVTLGFIFLVTAAGGVSDLLSADAKEDVGAFTAGLVPAPQAPELLLCYHW